jgi:hypothetical protein
MAVGRGCASPIGGCTWNCSTRARSSRVSRVPSTHSEGRAVSRRLAGIPWVDALCDDLPSDVDLLVIDVGQGARSVEVLRPSLTLILVDRAAAERSAATTARPLRTTTDRGLAGEPLPRVRRALDAHRCPLPRRALGWRRCGVPGGPGRHAADHDDAQGRHGQRACRPIRARSTSLLTLRSRGWSSGHEGSSRPARCRSLATRLRVSDEFTAPVCRASRARLGAG